MDWSHGFAAARERTIPPESQQDRSQRPLGGLTLTQRDRHSGSEMVPAEADIWFEELRQSFDALWRGSTARDADLVTPGLKTSHVDLARWIDELFTFRWDSEGREHR